MITVTDTKSTVFSSGIQTKNVAENNRCVIFSKWEKKWQWEGKQIRGKEGGLETTRR